MNWFDLASSYGTQAALIILSVIAANFDYRKRLTAIEKAMIAMAGEFRSVSDMVIRHDERLKAKDGE